MPSRTRRRSVSRPLRPPPSLRHSIKTSSSDRPDTIAQQACTHPCGLCCWTCWISNASAMLFTIILKGVLRLHLGGNRSTPPLHPNGSTYSDGPDEFLHQRPPDVLFSRQGAEFDSLRRLKITVAEEALRPGSRRTLPEASKRSVPSTPALAKYVRAPPLPVPPHAATSAATAAGRMLALTMAAATGGQTLLPHMRICAVLVSHLPDRPASIT